MVARRFRPPDAGFTYVGLVIFVAILGLVGAATLKVDSLLRRAAAEQELLEIGAEYSEALRSYAAATPRGYPTAPPTMQDLLKDPRFPGTRRHLRKIYVDPVTGKDEWGIVWQGDKVGVLALYSLSQAQPLKLANFDARFQNFENKEHLSEWKFTASGTGASAAPGAGGLPPGARPAGQPGAQPGSQPGGPPSLFPPPGSEPPPPTVPPPPAAPPPPAEPPEESTAEPAKEPEAPPAQPEAAEAPEPPAEAPPAEPAPAEPPDEPRRPGGR